VTGDSVLDRAFCPVLVAASPLREREAGATLERIIREIEVLGHKVVRAATGIDAAALATSDPSFGCILLDWNLDTGDGKRPAEAVVEAVRCRNDGVPVFLLIERADLDDIPLTVAERVQEYVLVLEDTPDFIAGRVDYAWRRYTDSLLPPFFRQLMAFTGSHEYSWHTPGHAGGTAFRKSPVGRAFYDFYGETLFRTDLSVSVGELGSLLDHSGAVQAAEANAARVFGASQTYFVLNGTSTSNRIVAHSCVAAGDLVVADRNCHKSVNYALTITDAVPVYLVPSRNAYGIIGPIPQEQLASAAVAETAARSALAGAARNASPVYAVLTNSTYDGLCYRADLVTSLLGVSVPRIHFDEAWFAYARFHPLYRNRYAMHDRPPGPGDPALYATQSTHKLLASFSQGSMIHIRPSRRAPVEPSRFNEAYMMHGSTSPFYPMIACLDVAAAMMDGAGGRALVDESIREAIRFRKQIVIRGRQLTAEQPGADGWFFRAWQPEDVTDPRTGTTTSLADAPDDLLVTEPSCWTLQPGQAWHGFGDLGDPSYCMLDPIKVTLTTPGIDATGNLATTGIPAPVVAAYLDAQRVEVEKTGDYTILLLFSIGTTRGKWGTLLDGLLAFKRGYDTGQPVSEAIPDLAAAYPQRYAGLTLHALCDQMHAEIRGHSTVALLDAAFGQLPEPTITPAEAYRRLVRGQTEKVPVSQMGGRIAAVMVVPYPPGIPILMPGECAGAADGPVLQYLLALQELDRKFPGFAHDIHGVERGPDGTFLVECITDTEPS
jgi:arginine decarboxylase